MSARRGSARRRIARICRRPCGDACLGSCKGERLSQAGGSIAAQRTAQFLDLDGKLLDIRSSPSAVHVAHDLAPMLRAPGVMASTDPKFVAMIDAIGRRLDGDGLLLRCNAPKMFGAAKTAFAVRAFWRVDALGASKRAEEARAILDKRLAGRNPPRPLNEDLNAASGELGGDLPQSYSRFSCFIAARRPLTGGERSR